jgi:hypothetical protein
MTILIFREVALPGRARALGRNEHEGTPSASPRTPGQGPAPRVSRLGPVWPARGPGPSPEGPPGPLQGGWH